MKQLIPLLLFASTSNAFATDHCDSLCQRALIDDYYTQINRVVVNDATPDHIDAFLNSLHDEVVYLHEEYQAEFNKGIWRKAFLRQMENGGYSDTTESGTTIKSIIHGYQTAAVEFISRYKAGDSKGLISAPPRLAIFKFKDNKIVFIQDHWYHVVE